MGVKVLIQIVTEFISLLSAVCQTALTMVLCLST